MTGRRILVADDEPNIANLLALILRRVGFHVDVVSNGREAIHQLQQHKYAVLLLDLMMPEVDGYDVIETLSTMPARPPVIVVTAAGVRRPVDLNPTVVMMVIQKPFDLQLLTAVVTEVAEAMPEAESTEVQEDSDQDNLLTFP